MNSRDQTPPLPDQTPDGSPGLLFLCVANSARSQLAEGLARALLPAGTRIASAGSAPRDVHPLAIRVLEEIGIDITSHRSKALAEIRLDRLDTAITLCAEESCALPPHMRRLHWPTEDPASVVGSEQDRIEAFRRARDEIRTRVVEFLATQVQAGGSIDHAS